MSPAPSGHQYVIRHGDQRATIVEVGGGIRDYDDAGRAVLDPYAADSMCDGAHGAVLVPWPNRLGDGRYRFDGAEHQVALSEPERQNAIHGLLRWRSWQPEEHGLSHIVMATTLRPMAGYPFCLRVAVDYTLGARGLTVTTTATNVGPTALPYGAGHHPYLSPGGGTVDACTVQVDARTRVLTDERQLPIGTEPVAGTPHDFRRGRVLGEQQVDDAFTDLIRDADGRAWVRLSCPDGRRVVLWVDRHHRYVELFTGDTLAPARRRLGLGTEPMTCPPNALQTGLDVQRLEPGGSFTSRWGVALALRRP